MPESKSIGLNDNGKEIILKIGRFGPYLQYDLIEEIKYTIKKKKSKKKTEEKKVRNVSDRKSVV